MQEHERPKAQEQINYSSLTDWNSSYPLFLEYFRDGEKAIAKRLTQECHLCREKPWSKNRILEIIDDDAYVGDYYYNKKP